MDSYTTLARQGEGEYVEKRSRFIGLAAPITTAEEATALVQQVRSKYYDARHHCYAYRLRDGGQRYADDGEPQGTAGLPILDVLERRDLVDCIIIVTRYFGGTLLGTGGLVRSYTAAANDALANTSFLTMQQYAVGRLACSYSLHGRVAPFIARMEGLIQNTDYGEQVIVDFLLPLGQQEKFQKELTELTYGEVLATFTGTVYGGTAEGQWFSAD